MEIQSHSYSSASSSSFVSSLVRPMTMSPKSPPHGGFDLCGKRRQMLKVQALEREIGLLEVSFLLFFIVFFFQVWWFPLLYKLRGCGLEMVDIKWIDTFYVLFFLDMTLMYNVIFWVWISGFWEKSWIIVLSFLLFHFHKRNIGDPIYIYFLWRWGPIVDFKFKLLHFEKLVIP